MQIRALVTVAAVSLLVSGCNDEPEETPDISEAIPLDEVIVQNEDGEVINGEDSLPDTNGSSDQGATWAGDPESVERGDNASAPPINVSDSKLQLADPN